jgi:2-dehydro-3-deoxyphosphogluconate aldolase/(4S)-4-hydroxy-2-oxoglutarate aldolase
MMTYLNSDLIAAVGGSWLAPREVIRDQDWKKIAQNAREAVAMVRG